MFLKTRKKGKDKDKANQRQSNTLKWKMLVELITKNLIFQRKSI